MNVCESGVSRDVGRSRINKRRRSKDDETVCVVAKWPISWPCG